MEIQAKEKDFGKAYFQEVNNMNIEEIVEEISYKYNENYGNVYDLTIHTRLKLTMRNPVKYIFKDVQLIKDTKELLNRYYRMKLYKETYKGE